ncbi:MAG: helix-turn-helix transcriptional regulator [Oscillospiraceae bacterium]|nr:helix-turn-helix transcriptional regulator [Oscillospiraceae bacterium]
MTSTELKEMAIRIKNRRKDLRFTQEQFAEIIGISASSYTRIENAFQKPSLDTLIKISQNLRISLDYIVLGSEKEKFYLLDRVDLMEAFLAFADKEKLLHTISVLDKFIKIME